MRSRRWLWLLLVVLLVAGLAAVLVFRVLGGEEVGPALALCPGPDEYGYRCETGGAIAYIDATQDTMLYADDNGIELELPFPFIFYGTQRQTAWVSSNGNLQFSSAEATYENHCLTARPAPGMGDMLAPYWDDLDLTALGFLETELIGIAPERIFVIEWDDVPGFGNLDERVTFEIQLFEGSNHIAFLYEDITRAAGNRGSGATIGVQSEARGYALQYSCNQFSLNDGARLRFLHPEAAGQQALGPGTQVDPVGGQSSAVLNKGRLAFLVDSLNRRGPAALNGLRSYWLSQSPRQNSNWLWADLGIDGRDQLVYWWSGPVDAAHLGQIVILSVQDDGQWRTLWQSVPFARQAVEEPSAPVERRLMEVDTADLTGDGVADLVIHDGRTGLLSVLISTKDRFALHQVPGACYGSLVLRDMNQDGLEEIVRDGCGKPVRFTSYWDGGRFISR